MEQSLYSRLLFSRPLLSFDLTSNTETKSQGHHDFLRRSGLEGVTWHFWCSKLSFLVFERMNIWISYILTAEIWIRKKIIAVTDTTFAAVKRKPEKKNQACMGLLFTGFLFTAAKVVSITTMIFFLSTSLSLICSPNVVLWADWRQHSFVGHFQ